MEFALTLAAGLVLFVLDVWALVNVAESPAGNRTKLSWFVLILLLPVVGVVAWLLAGPRRVGQ
ncbi:MAG: PLD nuclease N-terminal domain-containing protein [Candidatus Competibacteraceae bacterium]|nr:PLD nuclease N-terminal domain-containing protein [Candidatus Competibacteraceae bacterium]